ncbi:hypothetical protein TWF694_010966 [Orbilia ellipsospora]|uniref:CoA-transferase family III n=1 Tax=Orbilia ellipsospora TaxID=2528407 RepID=A0AAV9X7Y3_9PEZI
MLQRISKSFIMSRGSFKAKDIIQDIWTTLDLPVSALRNIELTGPEHILPSSYKLSLIPPAAISTSALAASLIRSHRVPDHEFAKVTVNTSHAAAEYRSELLNSLDGAPKPDLWASISGSYETADGRIVGIHANFPNHAEAALRILGLPLDCTDKAVVGERVKQHNAIELETVASANGAVIYALRTIDEWNATGQAEYLPDFPIILRKIGEAPKGLPLSMKDISDPRFCLQGLRVAEISRVLAGPICGRTLAAHGADVLWIHGPHLPSLPDLDIDTSRGKRSTFIDLRNDGGKETLEGLLSTADVFIQTFRPGTLNDKGFSPQKVSKLNNNGIIYASLNAFGEEGPWSHRRGFDSMVQLASGINSSEAEYYNDGSKLKKWPCQALDHTAGYFLAIGILAALHRRITEGGSWEVHVSLAGVMKYISSLGRIPGREGFDIAAPTSTELSDEFLETRDCELGKLTAVKHAGRIDGVEVGPRYMPTKLGHYEPKWEN